MSSTSPLGGLENRTMLAKFKVGKWSPSVADAKATKIIEDAKPDEDQELTAQEELGGQAVGGTSKKPRKAGKFRKWLIDVENPLWQAIISAEGRGRKLHKTLTLRWVVDGAGVLPAQATTSYRTSINRIRDDFFTAVDAFIAGLPALIAERRQALEPIGLFCEDDYPSNEKILQQFSFKYEIYLMSASMVSDELLNQLTEEDRQEILPLIGDGTASVMQTMENDLLERVAETVGRMAERLANPTAVFRDSLVENLRGLATTLGDLNVLNNEEIATIREQINQSLLVDPQSLRDDPTLRAQTAAVATEIAATAVRRIRSLAAPPTPSAPPPTEQEIAERRESLEDGLAIVRGESVVETAVQESPAIEVLAEAVQAVSEIGYEQRLAAVDVLIASESDPIARQHLIETRAAYVRHYGPRPTDPIRRESLEEGLAIVRGESVVEAAVQESPNDGRVTAVLTTEGLNTARQRALDQISAFGETLNHPPGDVPTEVVDMLREIHREYAESAGDPIRQNTLDGLARIREGLGVHSGHLDPAFVEGMHQAANTYEQALLDSEPATDETPAPAPPAGDEVTDALGTLGTWVAPVVDDPEPEEDDFPADFDDSFPPGPVDEPSSELAASSSRTTPTLFD